jgi:hypothetical protein
MHCLHLVPENYTVGIVLSDTARFLENVMLVVEAMSFSYVISFMVSTHYVHAMCCNGKHVMGLHITLVMVRQHL